jgi:ferredoxin
LEVKSFPVLGPVLDADVVISAAKMKTHGISYITGAVKNLFGAMPGLTKARMHARFPDHVKFNRMLVDLCECVRPAFSIVDGIVGMEGHGPSGGDPKPAGVLVASRSPYAADLACARIMGFPSDRVPILVDAASRGLVPSDADKLDWAGDPPERFAANFRPATSNLPGDNLHFLPKTLRAYIHRKLAPYPAIQPDCIGCGKCAEICPSQIIRIRDGRAAINYTGCIKCYCCHEICPVQAIRFVPPRRRPASTP